MSFSEIPPLVGELYARKQLRHVVHLQVAFTWSRLSTCYRRAAGVIGVNSFGRPIAMGYNGVPRDWPHCAVVSGEGALRNACPGALGQPGNTQSCFAEHAEQNAIQNCEAAEDIVKLYLTTFPCKTCAVMIANLPNLEELHYAEDYPDPEAHEVLNRLELLAKRGTRNVPFRLFDWSHHRFDRMEMYGYSHRGEKGNEVVDDD